MPTWIGNSSGAVGPADGVAHSSADGQGSCHTADSHTESAGLIENSVAHTSASQDHVSEVRSLKQENSTAGYDR